MDISLLGIAIYIDDKI